MLKITQEWSPNNDLVMKCQILIFVGLLKDIDILDVDAKTETVASRENSRQKSTENEQLEVLYKHTICTGVSQ